VTNFLWELGALGVVEEAPVPGTAALRAFFSTNSVANVLDASVREYLHGLERLGFRGAGVPLIVPLVDQDWASAWREHFRPLAVGASLLVAPSWDVPAASDRVIITIDPGRAFGTGHHGTTRGCLEAVERLVRQAVPATAIDVGTGSGILAIALARLGVARVLAVDDDPDAIAVATENAARNDVSARVECRVTDVAALQTPAAPLVVANLLTAAHHRFAATYARHVDAGGRLVLGGILEAEADTVLESVAAHGFGRVEAIRIDGWTTLVLERR
jgi:ribosomal protein L11 methyltransferase